MPALPSSIRPIGALFAIVFTLLEGCATPVFKDMPTTTMSSPLDVAAAPERYHDAAVVWGGRVIAVHNLADTTQVEVVAHLLDAAQRPDTSVPSIGRFVVVLPGYVESMDYPAGRWLSVRGHVGGSEVHRIDERDVVYPLLLSDDVHLWPASFPYEHGKFTFAFGIGMGIH
ncbi:MAG: Slp family lipoprotein [Dokdonella sp.]